MATANGSTRTFTATYVDTPDRRLARAGIPLRRRVEKGKSVWEARIGDTTVSAPGGPAGPPAEVQRVLAALLRGDEVVQVARVRRGENDVALMDGQRVLASYGDMDEALKEALEAPSQESSPSKDEPAVEHLREYLRTQLTAIERHDPAVRVGSDPEDLHKLRVAIRRSRAALREARSLLGEERGRELRDEHARARSGGLRRDPSRRRERDATQCGCAPRRRPRPGGRRRRPGTPSRPRPRRRRPSRAVGRTAPSRSAAAWPGSALDATHRSTVRGRARRHDARAA